MNVAVITTSRADYGIYASLLRLLKDDPDLNYGLVVSGSHLSELHGYTVMEIERDQHPVYGRVPATPKTTDAAGIALTLGEAAIGFAAVWDELQNKIDLVVSLGDRYEMFAAVAATVPYNLPVAHIHGGETTLGAIDDKFRHAISCMSLLHFPATPAYAKRVAEIVGSDQYVYAVGAPSLDSLEVLELPSIKEVQDKFGVDFTLPTILVTFHPETTAATDSENQVKALCETLSYLTSRYQIVLNLPNADTYSTAIRNAFIALGTDDDRVITIESFGKRYYFAALKYCKFLIGNSSSGLLEAPSFGKYTINLGDRQKGRAKSSNIIDVPVERKAILTAVEEVEAMGYDYKGDNVYYKNGTAAKQIVDEIKRWKIAKK